MCSDVATFTTKLTVRAARARTTSHFYLPGAMIGSLALFACGEPNEAPAARDTPPASEDTALSDTSASASVHAWAALPPIPAGFRAFAWGAGDTLWGIVRGRLAYAAPDGTVRRLEPAVWDVHASAAAALVSWTNEQGLHVRGAAGLQTLQRPGVIDADYLGPEVLWSPAGRRALLTWIGEAGTRYTVLSGNTQRALTARITGYMPGAPVLWLDENRVVLVVTAHGPRAGAPEHRESGYRSDIAILDVAADSMWRVTDAADGEYLAAEGLLHPDTVLVGSRQQGNLPFRRFALDTRTWRLTPRLEARARAAAAHATIALLRADSAHAAETEWELSILERGGMPRTIGVVTGYAVRLLWHPDRPRIAVSQDSEAPGGYRTFIVDRSAGH